MNIQTDPKDRNLTDFAKKKKSSRVMYGKSEHTQRLICSQAEAKPFYSEKLKMLVLKKLKIQKHTQRLMVPQG